MYYREGRAEPHHPKSFCKILSPKSATTSIKPQYFSACHPQNCGIPPPQTAVSYRSDLSIIKIFQNFAPKKRGSYIRLSPF